MYARRSSGTRSCDENRGGRIVRFQSLDIDFTADIAFDEQGIVLDYPGIARLAA